MAEFRRETGVLPREFARRGPSIRFRGGGEGEISGIDALEGEIYWLQGGFLLSDVQPLPYPDGGSTDGGRRIVR